MEELVGKRVSRKVKTWKFFPGRRYGLMTLEECPRTSVLIHQNQFVGEISTDGVTVGKSCEFTVHKGRDGHFSGRSFTLKDDDDTLSSEEADYDDDDEIDRFIHFAEKWGISVLNESFDERLGVYTATDDEIKDFFENGGQNMRKLDWRRDTFTDYASNEKATTGDDIKENRSGDAMRKSKTSDMKNDVLKVADLDISVVGVIDENTATKLKNGLCFTIGLSAKGNSSESGPDIKKSAFCRNSTADTFASTLKMFISYQKSQLVLDLNSNVKKGDADHADRVKSNFLNAVTYLMSPDTCPDSMTIERICETHRLVTDELLESAGVLRHDRGVRAGKKVFPSHADVSTLMFLYVEKLHFYLDDFLRKHSSESCDQINISVDAVREALLLVGWAGYHFLEIHPFNDGNGRMSRLLMYWVLLRCLNIPFPFCICSNPTMRKEFITAVRSSNHQQLSQHTGKMLTLAWDNYFNSCTEKFMKNALEPSNDSVSCDPRHTQQQDLLKLARASLSAECCSICMDKSPTICSLCCGKPIHLTCLRNWYTTQSRNRSDGCVSCPYCRTDISELNIDILPATSSNVDNSRDMNDESSTTFVEESSSEESSDNNPRPLCTGENCHNIRANHCTNNLCGRCCSNHGTWCNRHDRNVPRHYNGDSTTTCFVDDSSSAESSTIGYGDNARPLCTGPNCRNIRANHCSNDLCGRCCSNHGAWCNRHDTNIPRRCDDESTTSTTSYSS